MGLGQERGEVKGSLADMEEEQNEKARGEEACREFQEELVTYVWLEKKKHW